MRRMIATRLRRFVERSRGPYRHTKGAAHGDFSDRSRVSSVRGGAIARGFLACSLLLSPVCAADAEERIHRFVSDVQIREDSSLEVTETIDVRAEHDQINHGIFRDFPTRYRGRHGNPVRVGFTFEGATLDGNPVAAATEAFGNGIRVKIGDPDSLVDVGEHRYVLRYRTTRQLGRFMGFD
jgi:hypothetical protein